MVQLKLNDKTLLFPSSYCEITVRQFFAFRDDAKDAIDIMAILSGEPREWWLEQVEIDKVSTIMDLLSWINKIPNFEVFLVPDTIEIDGKRYKMPKELGLHTLDQHYCFEDLLMKASSNNDIDLTAKALAIYFQPLIDNNKFDRERLEEVEKMILNCKIEEAFPVAAFFLLKYKNYAQERLKRSPMNLHQMKSVLELTDLKNSANLQRFGIFRRVCVKILRKSYSHRITKFISGYYTTKTKRNTERS